MDALVTGLDRVRLGWLQLLGPIATPFVRSRELRSASSLTLTMLVAFVLTAVAPLELLAIGPIVLGVPHLAADVRYLVLRPGLHRRPAFWLAVVLPLVALGVTVQSWLGFVAVAGGVLALPRRWSPSRVLVALLAFGLAFVSWSAPRTIGPYVAQLHNLIAVAFFLAWPHLVGRARTSRWHLLPTLLFALATLAILAGAIDPLARGVGEITLRDGLGTSLDMHVWSLAPQALDPYGPLAMRLVLLFAFAQSVHYGSWLRAIPDEDRARATPRTFHASIAALRAEGSWPVMLVFAALALGLAIWAALDLHAARDGYLRGALFHGYLELAIGAAVLLSPRRELRALSS